MSEAPNVSEAPNAREPSRRRFDVPLWIGGAALLIAMATDALAVLGRHIGRPLLGSLELVQAAILVAASTALVAATLAGKHASARLLLDRLRPAALARMERINAVLTLLFFAALAAAQIWIASDLWGSHEESELLHLPYAPLRLVAIAAALLGLAISARRAVRARAS